MRLTVSDLIDGAVSVTPHSRAEITGPDRLRSLVRIRQAVYLLARREGHSFAMIGARIGRDHSTVMHGCTIATKIMDEDPYYTDTVREILGAARSIQSKRREVFLATTPLMAIAA